MRMPRFKVQDRSIFYHLYNRVAGEPDFLPFGPKEKEYFVRLLHKLDLLYSIKVVSYQVMSNHFHLVVHAPKESPSKEELCRRYEAYHDGKRRMTPSDPRCELWATRVRDISWYMQTLQQSFTRWFNRTRRMRRRGSLWADRFKHTILGDSQAVWECCKYVEMNAVRAGIVESPADYRFCSFGMWTNTGYHPFAINVKDALFPSIQGFYPFRNLDELYASMRNTFSRTQKSHMHGDEDLSVFVTYLDRRVRFWVDGLIIGTQLFIEDLLTKHRIMPSRYARRTSCTKTRSPARNDLDLCVFKQLRCV